MSTMEHTFIEEDPGGKEGGTFFTFQVTELDSKQKRFLSTRVPRLNPGWYWITAGQSSQGPFPTREAAIRDAREQ